MTTDHAQEATKSANSIEELDAHLREVCKSTEVERILLELGYDASKHPYLSSVIASAIRQAEKRGREQALEVVVRMYPNKIGLAEEIRKIEV